jgi:hypothetical protein
MWWLTSFASWIGSNRQDTPALTPLMYKENCRSILEQDCALVNFRPQAWGESLGDDMVKETMRAAWTS